jgi:transposase
MALPSLSPEQRAKALEKATIARKARADIKSDLKHGKTTLRKLVERGAKDDIVGKIKVSSLLEALPGVGKVKAQAIMAELDISDTRRVGGLGPNQVVRLLAYFE